VLVTVGLGWRPQTAWLIEQRGITFSEVIAETVDPKRVPPVLAAAVERGLVVIPHGTSLALGGAGEPDPARLARLGAVARALRAPLVSEHVAFVRAGGMQGAHFMPVPRSRGQLAVLVDNVKRATDRLPVPLALENVAAPLTWPEDTPEADFLAELVDRTGVQLVLDVANLHANIVNHGAIALDRLPLDRVAYIHVAGGARVDVMWRDTHAHAVTAAVRELLQRVLQKTGPKPVLLERDDAFPSRAELEAELDMLAAVVAVPQPMPREPRTYDALPAVTPVLRHDLEQRHASLLHALIDPARRPPRGFVPHHIAEARAIVRAKQGVARRCPRRSEPRQQARAARARAARVRVLPPARRPRDRPWSATTTGAPARRSRR
jgi:uncharacterized protein (UPF0276 family)